MEKNQAYNMSKSTFRKWLVLILIGISFYYALNFVPVVLMIFKDILNILSPVFYAIFLAYVLSVPMRSIEKNIFDEPFYLPQNKHLPKFFRKIKRPISLILSLLFLLGIIYFLVVWVLPEFFSAGSTFIKSLPESLNNLNNKILGFLEDKPEYMPIVEELNNNINKNIDVLKSYININTFINTLTSSLTVASAIGSGITNFILTLIISIYMLLSKEMLFRQWKRFAQAFLPHEFHNRYISPLFLLIDNIFSSYISGQFLDAVILGLMIMAGMLLFGIPYVVLIGVLVIIFAMLPLVGAFMSGGLGFLILVLAAPFSKAMIFLLIVVVCQQIEGNIIYPYIVGKSVNMPAIWVILALTVGGSLAGFWGILISIPVFSVFYSLISVWIRTRIYNDVKLKRRSFRQSSDELFAKVTNNLDWKDEAEKEKQN